MTPEIVVTKGDDSLFVRSGDMTLYYYENPDSYIPNVFATYREKLAEIANEVGLSLKELEAQIEEAGGTLTLELP